MAEWNSEEDLLAVVIGDYKRQYFTHLAAALDGFSRRYEAAS
ncbi:hypothetical protein DsansV1_C13g0121121 [Dioscorea sansibarensis]